MVQFYKRVLGRLMNKVGKSGRIVGEKIRREGLGKIWAKFKHRGFIWSALRLGEVLS